MEKKTNWVVRVLTAMAPGRLVWTDFRSFDDPETADNWLCELCRKNGYSITDFNIVRR